MLNTKALSESNWIYEHFIRWLIISFLVTIQLIIPYFVYKKVCYRYMKRAYLIYLLIISFFNSNIYVHATANTQTDIPPFEKPYLEIGFKSVEEALKECEIHNQRELHLPIKLPPVQFTHHLGRCIKDKNNHNDELNIEYLHEAHGEYHYMIDIRPIEQRINITKFKRNKKLYKLSDGSHAIYFTTKRILYGGGSMFNGGFNILVFEKNGWQYWLAIDTRIENQVTADILVEIAESVISDE